MNICVYGAASNIIDSSFVKAGEEVGEIMAKRGHKLVFGGGANGMMGAAARGMTANGGYIIGIVPKFLNADGVIYDKCDELHFTDDMRSRKLLLEDMSDAFLITAGGLGTFDELFEILTLKQLGRDKKAIAILNTIGYYDDIINMLNHCVKEKFMFEKSLELIKVFDDATEAIEYIENYKGELASIKEMKSIKI